MLRLILFLFLTMNVFAGNIGVYFSPSGGCDQALVLALNACVKTADLAIYSINHPDVRDAILSASKRGIAIRMVCDATEAAGKNSATKALLAAGIPLHIQHGSGGGIMHMKMAILDGTLVTCGSYNWTTRATNNNDEIEMVINDVDVAAACEKKFELLWQGVKTRKLRHRRGF